MGPFGKFDLGDQHGFDPVATFHDGVVNPEAPLAFGFLRQVDKGTGGSSDLLQLCVNTCQEFLGKAGPDPAREHEPIRTLVADEQGPEVFPISFRQRVPAYNELLRFSDLEFDPGAAGPAAPQMLLAGSGGRMAGNRGLHAGRHACPGGQAVLVPDSFPADQRSFFATSAMFILSLCRAAK